MSSGILTASLVVLWLELARGSPLIDVPVPWTPSEVLAAPGTPLILYYGSRGPTIGYRSITVRQAAEFRVR